MTADRVAVILFNLGGPDSPDAVQPFLLNLFSDPAILRLPWGARQALARFIAVRRAPVAKANYAHLGGASPLLPNTRAQAQALEQSLQAAGLTARCFVAMRYWRPFAAQTARQARDWRPDRVVLLPLYPQFSTTTTASALRDWGAAARRAGLRVETHSICCYPCLSGWIEALADGLDRTLSDLPKALEARVLFSAHGLPERIVRDGDPYQWQVEQTAAAVAARLGDRMPADWRVCYQSRVGRLRWIAPATEDEIRAAGQDGRPVVIVPIAFVSEHVETLVELDREYRDLAAQAGVPAYHRAPAVGVHPSFIAGLTGLVRSALSHRRSAPQPDAGARLCPARCRRCPVT